MPRVELDALPWQAEFIACENDPAPVIGGVGSGKSWAAGLKFALRAVAYPHGAHYIIVPTLKSARYGTLATFKSTLDDLKLEFRQNLTDLSIEIRTGKNLWTRVIVWPATEYERLKGQEIDTAWCDECQVWERGGEAYDFLVTRMRNSPGAVKHHPGLPTQIVLSANPPHSMSHWLYQKFVRDAVAPKLFHVTTLDNHILLERDPSYLERLRTHLSPELYDIEVLGKWGNLGVGLAYTAFDRSAHAANAIAGKGIELDWTRPIYWTHDFGVHPRVSLLFVIIRPPIKIVGYQDEIIYVFAELNQTNGSTMDQITQFVAEYPPAQIQGELVLMGDPAGQTRNSTTGLSDWALLTRDPRLQSYRGRVDRAAAAPLVVDRVNAVNTKLRNAKGEIGVLIDPRCIKTLEDLEQTRWDDKDRKLDHGNATKGILRTHWSDALGYPIARLWPVTTSATRVVGHGWMAR